MTGSKRIVRDRLPMSVRDTRRVISAGAQGGHMALSRSFGDSLYNLATGMGGTRDKSTQTMFGFTELPKQQLEMAYRGDWVSRKIVDIPAYDATREWRTWQGDKKDITAIEDVEKKLRIRKKMMMALQRARLYGGGALVMGVDQGKSDEPLDIEKLQKDCLKWVHPVSRYELTAGPIDWDLSSPYFGTPAYYTRSLQAISATAATTEQMRKQAEMNATRQQSGAIQIHPSRIARFVGMEPPEWNMAQGWGDSVLNVVADAVISLGTVNQALTALIHESKLDIVRIPELSERISNTEYESRLNQRFATANLMKSLFSVLLLDREEEWQRVEQTFTGIPEVMLQFMIMVCGAADIPATRFMSQSPQGMNATGESDTRNYYDRVSTGQELEITPATEDLDKIAVISALGKFPDGMFYEWNPLWQMDEAQKADIAVKQSTVMAADVAAGLLDPAVLQHARENQLIESGFYPGIEQIIDEYGTEIDERAPDPSTVPTHIDPETGQPADPATNPKAVPNPQNKNPFAGRQPPVPANENANDPAKKAGAQDAISAMAARIRDNITDASTPRTLYVYRAVKNWKEIAKWFEDQGVANVIREEQHVTVCYSKTPVDWLKVGADNWGSEEDGGLIVKPGGPRVMEKFGNYLVMAFSNSDLQYRHCSILERTGGSWDYDDYTPHVSISKDAGAIDIMGLKPWTGEIVFGPEEFEEIKPDYYKNPGDPVSTYDRHPQYQGAPIAHVKDANAIMTEGLAAIVDAIRTMPPPVVQIAAPAAAPASEYFEIVTNDRGRPIGLVKKPQPVKE